MVERRSRSIQDVLRSRQAEAFVGRESELDFFVHNLESDEVGPNRRFLISIHGQGGAGKSSLMRQFETLSRSAQYETAWADDSEPDALAVMRRQADALKGVGSFKDYFERDRKYQQLCQQIEADPELPKGLAGTLGQGAGVAVVRLGRRAPGIGVAFDYVDEKAVAEHTRDLFSFVGQKLGNKDEVALVRDPLRILTPLFLEGIRTLEAAGVVLFFDTYEQTSHYMDEWLIGMLDGSYGELATSALIVVAGREPLSPARWQPYSPLHRAFHLDVLDEVHARELLARKGITHESTVSQILRASGRLPVLVAMLAVARPEDGPSPSDAAATAVELFLKWTPDSKLRTLALRASIPRMVNRDVLEVLLPDDSDAELAFEWLKGLPFVLPHQKAWRYHPLVRRLMLQYQYSSSPIEWNRLHQQLVAYYTGHSSETAGVAAIGQTARRNLSEITYHEVASNPSAATAIGVAPVLLELRWPGSELDLAEAIRDADDDCGRGRVDSLGYRLIHIAQLREELRFEAAVDVVTELLRIPAVAATDIAVAAGLRLRAMLHDSAHHHDSALRDLDEVERLARIGHEAVAAPIVGAAELSA